MGKQAISKYLCLYLFVYLPIHLMSGSDQCFKEKCNTKNLDGGSDVSGDALWWRIIRDAFLLGPCEWLSYEDRWGSWTKTHKVIISYKFSWNNSSLSKCGFTYAFNERLYFVKFLNYFLFLFIFMQFFMKPVTQLSSVLSHLSCISVHFCSFSFCFVWIPHA